MNNTFKFYIKNRFMYVTYMWCLILCVVFNGNPYINVVVLSFGFIGVIMAFAYIDEDCKLNAQERLFLKKLSSITD